MAETAIADASTSLRRSRQRAWPTACTANDGAWPVHLFAACVQRARSRLLLAPLCASCARCWMLPLARARSAPACWRAISRRAAAARRGAVMRCRPGADRRAVSAALHADIRRLRHGAQRRAGTTARCGRSSTPSSTTAAGCWPSRWRRLIRAARAGRARGADAVVPVPLHPSCVLSARLQSGRRPRPSTRTTGVARAPAATAWPTADEAAGARRDANLRDAFALEPPLARAWPTRRALRGRTVVLIDE